MIRSRKVAKVAKSVADELGDRLVLVEEALRAQQVDAPMSANSAALVTAVAAAIDSLGSRPGVIWIDRLIIVKEADDDGGLVRTAAVSAEQVRELRRQGADEFTPSRLLRVLDQLDAPGSADSAVPPIPPEQRDA